VRCPPNCQYLAAARQHPAAVVRREQERDLAALLPALERLTPGQGEMLWLVLTRLAAVRPDDGFVRTNDEDVAEAAGSLAATFETATRGILYEHRPVSPSADGLARAIREALDGLPEARRPGFEADAAAALRAVEQGARDARTHLPGRETAYLALAGRVTRRAVDEPPGGGPADGSPDAVPQPPSRLILP